MRQAGGLFIIGTERHDSRRIDNQLRGRAGRQGDPGETRFYISLEDDLMRLFGGERVQAAMERMNIDEDMPIESKMLTRCHPAGPDHRGVPELPGPKVRAGIRRRDEQAAGDHLWPAPPGAGGHGREGRSS